MYPTAGVKCYIMKKNHNKYVFLSYGIGGVGGGQNYLKNRCELYKEQGYKVYLAYTLYDPKCDSFLFDAVKRIQAIGQPINIFGKCYINRVINQLINLINYNVGDCVIIESNNMYMAFWGEMLAKSCGGKHFYYILGENDIINNNSENSFFSFKLDRSEIAGIHQDTIKKFFSKFRIIENSDSYHINATAQISFMDYRVPRLENLPFCEYCIGLLSRLDKPFVLPTLIDLKAFFNNHRDKRFNLIIVGDGNENIVHKIKQLYNDINNVNLIFTGALEPLPTIYPELCDVCIGTSGCAWMTHKYGRITISIDGEDFKPIGILGHTTDNRLFRSEEPIVELKIILNQILFEKKYSISHSPIQTETLREETHKQHHEYILNSSKEKQYFDLSDNVNLVASTKGFKFIVKRSLEKLIGSHIYYKIIGKL